MSKNRWLLALLAWVPLLQAAPGAGLPGMAPVPVTVQPPDPRQSWAAMAPVQQRELRTRYASWQSLDEAERRRIRQAAAAFALLSPNQQTTLRARFAAQDQLHRDGWRLGPRLGVLYPKLQPLFGYLPPEQREPAMALLRQLDDGQLAQLALISQRTPPQDRAAVREQLLGLAPAARDVWLQQRVGR